MTSLCELTLVELRDGLRRRSFSAREATLACIDRLTSTRKLNAFITETADRALLDAARADTRLGSGTAGPLEGVPIGVKDMYCTAGIRTTAGSRMLKTFIPTYESAVTARMWDAGGVLLGKTNQDEFAMGSSCLTSAFGPVISPIKAKSDSRDLVPGGSSGGAAAAVASYTVPAALGTDTGGSVRQPASFCGIVGLKPTYGRCSRWGIIAYASSLDQAGVLTRTVRDAAVMLREMAGGDPRDSTCADIPVPDYESAVGRSIKGMRIGVPREYRLDGLSSEVMGAWDQAVSALSDAGAVIEDVSVPLSKYALPAYYIIAPAEASSNFARYDGVRYGLRLEGENITEMYQNTRQHGFGPEVRRRVLIGTYALSAGYYDAFYKRAQQVRRRLSNQFSEVLTNVDALLFPTSPIPPFPIDDDSYMNDPVAMYLIDVFTVTVNLIGLPAISIPFGVSREGLPLGLQLLGRPFDEETILRIGEVLYQSRETPPYPAYLVNWIAG